MASLFLEFPLEIMPRITHFGFRDLPTINEARAHRHFGYEFVYFVDGHAPVRLLPGDTPRQIAHDDLLIVPPGAYHCFESAESGFTYYWLGLQTSTQIAIAHVSNWPSPGWDHDPNMPPPATYSVDGAEDQLTILDAVFPRRRMMILHGHSEVLPIFVRLRDEICRARSLSRSYLFAKLLQLVVTIVRGIERYTPPEARKEVDRAVVYLEANLYRKLNLREVVEQTGVPRRRLYRGFQERFGCTPMQYLCELRVEEAKRLLRRGQSSESVALACGFSSGAHLCRVFRAAVGQTPGAFARTRRWEPLSETDSRVCE